jgi:hypothetical protein
LSGDLSLMTRSFWLEKAHSAAHDALFDRSRFAASYALRGETERATAELDEARRLSRALSGYPDSSEGGAEGWPKSPIAATAFPGGHPARGLALSALHAELSRVEELLAARGLNSEPGLWPRSAGFPAISPRAAANF